MGSGQLSMYCIVLYGDDDDVREGRMPNPFASQITPVVQATFTCTVQVHHKVGCSTSKQIGQLQVHQNAV